MAGGNFSANGFACWHVSALGFFGTVGVNPAMQRKGIGAAPFRRRLESMLQQGYGYAVIGGVSDPEFYAKSAGRSVAVCIAGSTAGIYRGLLEAPVRLRQRADPDSGAKILRRDLFDLREEGPRVGRPVTSRPEFGTPMV
jgi:hypothetical protein